MVRSKTARFVALVGIFTLIAAACSTKTTNGGGSAQKGGILRIQAKTQRWTDSFDPSGEYLGAAQGMMSNLLTRSLLGYRHIAGVKGNETIPDLATDTGTISADGLSWKFTLKAVKFGQPINRLVKPSDILYSFQRIATKSVAAQYGFYYLPTVVGMQDFLDGKATTITGIVIDDAAGTIEFKLTKPTGDFNYRLSMPATAPIPPEVGKCFEKAGEYGKYLIATGPYQFVGINSIIPTSCATLKASGGASGFDPSASGHMKLERNPNYDPSTDTVEAREALFDGLDLETNSNVDDIFAKIQRNEVDAEFAKEPPQILQLATTTLKGQIHALDGDRTWYFSMNLTEPPFDDVHVRRAMNFVIDRAALLRLAGGSIAGTIAGHDFPPSMLQGRLATYAPFASPGNTGDVTKAMAEMKLSKYDTNKDGTCDAAACKGVYGLTEDAPPFSDYVATVKADFAKVGVSMDIHAIADSYPTAQDVSKKIPFFMGGGWGKDYADLFTYAFPLFYGPSILATGNSAYPLVGLSAKQAHDYKADYPAGGVASVDADIDACSAKSGALRLDCWAALDQKLTFDVAAWIPYRFANNVNTTSTAVTKYEFDQSFGEMAFAHMAVDKTKQVG